MKILKVLLIASVLFVGLVSIKAEEKKAAAEKEAKTSTASPPHVPPQYNVNNNNITNGTKAEEEDEEVAPYLINLVVVIMNENHPFHITRAEKLKQDILTGAPKELRNQVRVVALHPEFTKVHGGWTLLPLAKPLCEKYKNANWFYFVNEFVMINVEKIFKELIKYDAPTKALFLGRAIRDSRPVILHHFQFADGVDGNGLEYPELSAGFFMSKHLLSRLINNGDNTIHLPNPNTIDLNYELAKLIREKFSYRVLLKNLPYLCGANWRQFTDPDKAMLCLTEMHWDEWMDTYEMPASEICYAVKTHAYTHQSRVKLLRETWANKKVTKNQIKFYSDTRDDQLGTIAVPPHIPNVERGHCEKTLYILKDFVENDAARCKWLVLVDDDTIVNTSRMARVLKRYSETVVIKDDSGIDAKTGKPHGEIKKDVELMAIGERYGFNHWPVIDDHPNKAYDFLTGGAGIAFSRSAVKKMVEECQCGLRDPDDMMLGLCMTRINIPMINNPLFHQGSPLQYPNDLIRFKKPVTFHSFNEIDGRNIYDFYINPEMPKKFDGMPQMMPPHHVQFPTTTPNPGLFPAPKVAHDGKILEGKTNRLAGFDDPMIHEEL